MFCTQPRQLGLKYENQIAAIEIHKETRDMIDCRFSKRAANMKRLKCKFKDEVQIQIKKIGIITHNHSKIDTRETTTLNVQYRYALSLAVFDEICIGGILLLKWYEVDQYQTERVCDTSVDASAYTRV